MGSKTILEKLRACPSYAQGAAEAEHDIAAGKLKLKLNGKIAPQWEAAAQILRAEYGIELQVDAHCIVPIEKEANSTAYNERMRQEIAARFGPSVEDAVWKRVHKNNRRASRAE